MRNENGFTLVETLVTLVIVSMIALGATAATGQILKVTRLNKEWSTVVRQAQNAGYWVSHDAVMATTVTVNNTANADNISMAWSDWETGNLYKVSYLLEPVGSKYRLERRYKVTDKYDTVVLRNIGTLIAEDISGLNASWDGTALSMNVTAAVGTKSVTRNYGITPRLTN